jgi:hypothetical protein
VVLGGTKQGNTVKALSVLVSQAEKFPTSPTLAYFLACYSCSLDKIGEAEKWLHEAFTRCVDPQKMKLRAMDQPELEKLWGEVQEY